MEGTHRICPRNPTVRLFSVRTDFKFPVPDLKFENLGSVHAFQGDSLILLRRAARQRILQSLPVSKIPLFLKLDLTANLFSPAACSTISSISAYTRFK